MTDTGVELTCALIRAAFGIAEGEPIIPALKAQMHGLSTQLAAAKAESAGRLRALNDAEARVEKVVESIPTNWLDPLLTGPKAVIGPPPYNCRDIENLLQAVRARAALKGASDA